MFTALKGWNLHTQTFNTLEEYFNPLINPNYRISRHANFSNVWKGFKKVFNREFIKSTLPLLVASTSRHNSAQMSDFKQSILRRILDDEEINLYTLTSLCILDGPRDGTVALNFCIPYWTSSRCYPERKDRRYAHHSGEAFDTFIAEVLRDIKATQTQHLDLENLESSVAESAIDAALFIPNHNSSYNLLWYQHFSINNYYRVVATEDEIARPNFAPRLDADNVSMMSDAASRMTPSTRIHIQRWLNGFGVYPEIVMVHVRDPNDRSHLYRVLNYSTDVLRHLPSEIREPNELSSNLYGIELEVSADGVLRQIIDAPDKVYCCIKSDSSIQGSKNNAYEIVSAPATTKAHKKAWAQILDKVPYTAFDVSLNTNNGMHIHIDMKAFPDQTHLKNFVWFFTNPVNKDFLIEIGERDKESFEQYTMMPELHGNLIRCFNTCMSAILPPFRGIVHYKQARDMGEFVTLEVRLFKGIVSLASICKNLEFVDAVYNFTTKCSYITNTVPNFLHFLDRTYKNRFTTLKEFIKRIDLDQLLNTIQFRQVIHGVQEPKKLVALLNNQTIVYNDTHLSTLNNLIENTKFAIKDGKVYLTRTNRSLVYDLDLALGQRLIRKQKDKTTCV